MGNNQPSVRRSSSATEDNPLLQPVQYVKGVGPQRAELLRRLNVETVGDLLFFFPRAYEEFGNVRKVSELQERLPQSVIGVVEDIESRVTRKGQTVVVMAVACDDGYVRAIWFHQPFRREVFRVGQRVMLSGRPRRNGLFWEMAHPRVTILGVTEAPAVTPLPVYPLTEGLAQWQLRRIVEHAVGTYTRFLEEALPPNVLTKRNLMPIQEAVEQIHFPTDQVRLEQARRRFIYEELLILQLALGLKRYQQVTLKKAPVLKLTPKIDARIRRLFRFRLTSAQDRAVAEIAADMGRPVPMNRLLQGDVGSGKTVVALYAMLLAVACGHQAVLMAPTEILARQHYETINKLLAASRVRRALLVGGLPAGERAEILEKIAQGGLDLVVGTQAIIQDEVKFHRLGLVVIDEQHKFGVRQRAALKGAGEEPHYLVMTATPIPRTIAMTIFGDLDLTLLDEAPPGRKPVRTFLANSQQRAQWWAFFRRKLQEGRQGYVVVPLVEGDVEAEVKSVEGTYRNLSQVELSGFRLGMVHGRMSSEEKEQVMARFRRKEIDVLISTAVIEVGIDVPNATLMTIENGERFGLAQLHQLRGRVSRGPVPGYCCVFSDTTAPETRERLEAFCRTTNGFELAEIDFALRGPGELLGTRQHGLPPFRIADLVRDREILEIARQDAWELIARDPGLARPEHRRLRRLVLTRYGKRLALADVG